MRCWKFLKFLQWVKTGTKRISENKFLNLFGLEVKKFNF